MDLKKFGLIDRGAKTSRTLLDQDRAEWRFGRGIGYLSGILSYKFLVEKFLEAGSDGLKGISVALIAKVGTDDTVSVEIGYIYHRPVARLLLLIKPEPTPSTNPSSTSNRILFCLYIFYLPPKLNNTHEKCRPT